MAWKDIVEAQQEADRQEALKAANDKFIGSLLDALGSCVFKVAELAIAKKKS